MSALRLLVLKTSVGAIIGKGGATIQRIASESGAAVSIESEYTKDRILRENVREIVLTISYTDVKQLTQALSLLAPILRETREEALRDKKSDKVVPEGEQYLTALIHSAGVVSLLDKEGEKIKKVQEDSQTVIKIRKRLPQSSESSISFKGTLDQVIKAFFGCLPALLDRSGEDKFAYRPYSASIPPRSQDPIANRSFDIPAASTVALLRNRGARVQYIRKTTSCSVHIDLPDGAEKAKVTIKGPQSNLHYAISMVRFTPSTIGGPREPREPGAQKTTTTEGESQ
jgi:hypothetical protein